MSAISAMLATVAVHAQAAGPSGPPEGSTTMLTAVYTALLGSLLGFPFRGYIER